MNLDNSLSAVDFVRMGAVSVKDGASGTLHWDEFESRRDFVPSASIASPSDGEVRTAGVPIVFIGGATDPEDGTLSGASLTWTSDLDGPIGTGASFAATLSAGAHVVTLTGTDADGNTGLDQISLTIMP